jgi:phosphatidylserine/phosphatidylglycerophosphate/cardiolipin synthase-like enzyme
VAPDNGAILEAPLRTSLMFLLILSLLAARPLAAEPLPRLQLVESVPVETDWDTPAPNSAETWVALFESARTTIDLAQFYLAHEPGHALDPVLAALKAAADRGVKVRILAEKEMAEESADTLADLGSHANIDWAWFDIHDKTGGIIHAKYMVIDGTVAFVGSQNFDWRALEHIHEIGVRIADASAARSLQILFDVDWQAMRHHRWTFDTPVADRDQDGLPDSLDPAPDQAMCEGKPGAMVCPVFAPPTLLPPGFKTSLEALVGLLDQAVSAIDIQVMTYDLRGANDTQWRVLDDALLRAAGRGVQIRLNIADWSLKAPRIDALKALQRVTNISVRVNSIPDWSGGHIPYARVDHSKIMVIDGRVGWVGTSNWGQGYFDSVRAVEVYFDIPATVKELAALFDKGWSGPYATDLDVDKEYTPRNHH